MTRRHGRFYCLSHVDDIDGVSSAALVKAATGAEIKLTDYDNFLADLQNVPSSITGLVICDIGFDEAVADRALGILGRVRKKCPVIYIDHHSLNPKLRSRLESVTELVWDDRECASTLTYTRFANSLGRDYKRLAAYGAVTDYRDQSPTAKRILEVMSRHTVFLEATLLSNALTETPSSAMDLVDALSSGKRPAQIPGVMDHAMAQLSKAAANEQYVAGHGSKSGRIGWVKVGKTDHPSVFSTIVEGILDVSVGIAYKEKQEGWYDISMRSTDDMKFHLGEVVGKFCAKNGWAGGGHTHAAGCKIPKEKLSALLYLLDSMAIAAWARR
ncbi:MAG: hypothetical protein JRN21_09900 [Nitrososphaerota archaeon]|nr:hypothetical protein [Nitrososphaerota archaeon]